ncbi:alpha/beta fold hydrolase [Fulvivirga ligni]|uniref:alpha/beta fold hydrolase n=1 Tax=Fulvivirga ligni TaxID=2904246 RepID=UPI001F2D08B1|nr:alpha/beta hydrolase [Fulvivirga ligni]UII19805.1 alpha/beta hydrolase [Fulvivirga ligni]
MRIKAIITSIMLCFSGIAFSQDIKPLGIALEGYEYPYPVSYISLNIQGEALKMAYMDVKPEKPNGKTIMLMHGKNFCGAYWGQTAKDLSKAGFRVVIPDQIGFGKSSKPKDIQYTFQLLAQNTKALLDSIGVKKTSVLGHSMGGMIATRFTLMYPESVDKFILENPIGLEDWKLKVPYVDVEQWYKQELKKTSAGIKKYMLESYYDGKWKPEYDKWVKILAGWTLSPEYPTIAWNSALTYDMIFTQPVVYEFPNIKAPTLLIIGQRDRTALGKNLVSEEVRKTMGNYPELGRTTQKSIPNSKLVEIDNIGHLPHIEAYDRFITPLLKFLQN